MEEMVVGVGVGVGGTVGEKVNVKGLKRSETKHASKQSLTVN